MTRNALTLLQGTVDLLVLRALQRGPRTAMPCHAGCETAPTACSRIEDAALYQALHRLEAKRWIEAEWGLSDNNRRAKDYTLTPRGPRTASVRGDDLEALCRRDGQSARSRMRTPMKPSGIRRLFRFPSRAPRDVRDDVRDELRFHLEMRTARSRGGGPRPRRGAGTGSPRVRRRPAGE